MGNLFICDTPFQVMTALLISWANFRDSDFDCIVTDNMPGAAAIADRLLFVDSVRDAKVAHVKHSGSSDFKNRIGYFLDLFAPYGVRWPGHLNGGAYDCLFLRNYEDPYSVSAFHHFRRYSDLKLMVYDEGYSTYSSSFWTPGEGASFSHAVSNRLARIVGKSPLFDFIESAYLYDPGLLHIDLPFPVNRLLPRGFHLGEHRLHDLNTVFGFKMAEDPILDFLHDDSIQGRKYLFFEECFAADRGNQDDLGVLGEIAKAVGKDRILVKTHPRSVEDRFSRLGYRVVRSHGYPWEIVALNMDEEIDVVLVSFSSGALLNYRFLCGKNIRSVLLYKLFPGQCNQLDSEELQFFEDFRRSHPETISIPNSRDELSKALYE